MEKIDWQEITEELGEDRWRDDWINLPRQSRLLLSKFVQEDRFLARDYQQTYYGPDSQAELYNAAKIAHNALILPAQRLDYVLACDTSQGRPGMSYAGRGEVRISGDPFPISGYDGLGVGFRNSVSFANLHAIGFLIESFTSASFAYLVAGRFLTNRTAPITGFRLLVSLSGFLGDTSGYDSVFVGSKANYGNFIPLNTIDITSYLDTCLIGGIVFGSSASMTIQVSEVMFLDINGNNIITIE